MAKVIEFSIPTRFRKKVAWVSAKERGKIRLAFSVLSAGGIN